MLSTPWLKSNRPSLSGPRTHVSCQRLFVKPAEFAAGDTTPFSNQHQLRYGLGFMEGMSPTSSDYGNCRAWMAVCLWGN